MTVLGGRSHYVGSRKSRIKDAIQEQTKQPTSVDIKLKGLKASKDKYKIQIDAKAKDKDSRLFVALTYSGIKTSVKRGENTGRELINDHIVFSMEEVSNPWSQNSIVAEIPRLKKDSPANIVVFARDNDTLAVLGANQIKVQ